MIKVLFCFSFVIDPSVRDSLVGHGISGGLTLSFISQYVELYESGLPLQSRLWQCSRLCCVKNYFVESYCVELCCVESYYVDTVSSYTVSNHTVST